MPRRDPTAQQALANIERDERRQGMRAKNRRIYPCTQPSTSDELRRARKLVEALARL